MHSNRMILKYHEVFGTWFVENLKAMIPHERGYYLLKTNSKGIRSSREYDLEKPEGIYRIIVIGDSYTAGDGVNNEERFSDILEMSLDGVEVINLGLSGSSVVQQLLIYEYFGDKFKADMLLLCPSVEDINRNSGQFWPFVERTTGETIFVPKPYVSIEGKSLKFWNIPVPKKRISLRDASKEVLQKTSKSQYPQTLLRLYQKFRSAFLKYEDTLFQFFNVYNFFPPYPQYNSRDNYEWLLMEMLLTRFRTSNKSIKIVLAPLPTFHYIKGLVAPNYVSLFNDIAKNNKMYFIDLLMYFRGLDKDDRRKCCYSRDVHFTSFGHSVVAEALKIECSSLLYH